MTSRASDPLLGVTLDGRFRLDRLIGRGGMGRVYEALQLSVGRRVAVKVLLEGARGESVGTRRFLREATAVAQFTHPNIVRLVDFGEDEDLGILYLVMDLVDGVSLAELLGRGPLEWSHAVRLVAGIASGLSEAHALGVLHRDLKPENVMISTGSDGEAQPLILDFGVALSVADQRTRLTNEGAFAGTAAYMAPEQADHDGDVGPPADLYALGVILFQAVTGARPFEAPTIFALVIRKLREEPPRLRDAWPEAPTGLAALVDNLLQRDPARRIGSARELVERCIALLGSGDLTVRVDTGAADPYHAWFDTGSQPTPATSHTSSRSTDAPVTPSDTDDSSPVLTTVTLVLAAVGAALAVVAVGAIVTMGESQSPAPASDGDAPPVAAPLETQTELRTQGDVSIAPVPAVDVVDTGQDEGTTSVVASTGCGKEPPFEGRKPIAMSFRGVDRYWIAYLPSTYTPDEPHPVMLLFHDSQRDANYAVDRRGMVPIADREGFVIIAPDAHNRAPAWRERDDVDFVTAALQETARLVCLDQTRVYAVGHGSGGQMVERMMCHRPFSAAASTSYLRLLGDDICRPQPTPYIQFWGMRDDRNPYGGGHNCLLLPNYSADETRERWREFYDCALEPTILSSRPDGTCSLFACERAPYATCAIDGGYDWPGERSAPFLTCKTPVPTTYPYAREIWRFLHTNERPVAPFLAIH